MALQDEPDPDIGENEVLVRVRACAIGRRDLECYSRGSGADGDRAALFGHEASGVVAAVGARVHQVKPRDRVVVRTTQTGFAEYCKTDAAHVAMLPDTAGFEEGAIASCLPPVVRGVERGVRRGDTVFVSGMGAVGMLSAQVARAYGAARIIVADLYERRLRRITGLAAAAGINASTEDVTRRVCEETRGRGADVCIECAGVEASFRNCEAVLRSGGTLVAAGAYAAPVALDLAGWAARSLRLLMAQEQPEETAEFFHKALRLVETEAVALRPLLTHVFPLRRASEAFELLVADPGRAVKIAIVP